MLGFRERRHVLTGLSVCHGGDGARDGLEPTQTLPAECRSVSLGHLRSGSRGRERAPPPPAPATASRSGSRLPARGHCSPGPLMACGFESGIMGADEEEGLGEVPGGSRVRGCAPSRAACPEQDGCVSLETSSEQATSSCHLGAWRLFGCELIAFTPGRQRAPRAASQLTPRLLTRNQSLGTAMFTHPESWGQFGTWHGAFFS